MQISLTDIAIVRYIRLDGAPFAGVGAVPGAVVGGIVGSWFCGWGGSEAGEAFYDGIVK